MNWTNSGYAIVWKSAFDVWMESPWFGAGLHKYREACELLALWNVMKIP